MASRTGFLNISLGPKMHLFLEDKFGATSSLPMKPFTVSTQRRNGTPMRLALKSSTNKAYDKVEWDFVKALLEKMGFAA